MPLLSAKSAELKCPACNGTRVAAVSTPRNRTENLADQCDGKNGSRSQIEAAYWRSDCQGPGVTH
jgi:hypothetical protein